MDSTDSFSTEEKKERLGPFFVRDVSGHQVKIKLSPSVEKTVTTDADGRFKENIPVDSITDMTVDGQTVKYTALDKTKKSPIYAGLIYLMKDTAHGGCSIISDIDDTIKISEVPDKTKLVVNTFKKDFVAVPGMAELYSTWQTSHACLLHYVSAMPSQLYHATQKFLDRENFPPGSFHMRHLKLMDSDKTELLTKLLQFIEREASQKHKVAVIRDILQNAPSKQRFVLVGDSGELDPEVYGIIAREHADRIKSIFIRQVEGGLNDESRFLTAFKSLPKEQWTLFSNADELPKKLFEESNSPEVNDPDNDGDDGDDDKDASPGPVRTNGGSFPSRSLWSVVFSIFFAVHLIEIDR